MKPRKPKIASKQSEARGEASNAFLLPALGGSQAHGHLDLGLLASEDTSYC